RSQVQELLKESVALTQNRNPAYLLAYGEAARNNGDMDAAFGALQTLVQTPGATQEQLNAAYDRLNRISIATDQRLKVAFTPAVQQTPAVPVISVAPVVTTQTLANNIPAVPATATASDVPAWKRLWESVKSGSIINEISGLT